MGKLTAKPVSRPFAAFTQAAKAQRKATSRKTISHDDATARRKNKTEADPVVFRLLNFVASSRRRVSPKFNDFDFLGGFA
jgi:hypothetical protein